MFMLHFSKSVISPLICLFVTVSQINCTVVHFIILVYIKLKFCTLDDSRPHVYSHQFSPTVPIFVGFPHVV